MSSLPNPGIVNFDMCTWVAKKKAHRRLELQIPPPDVEVCKAFTTLSLRPLRRCKAIDFTPYILRLNNNERRRAQEEDRVVVKTQENKKRLLDNIISPPSPIHTCNKCFEERLNIMMNYHK